MSADLMDAKGGGGMRTSQYIGGHGSRYGQSGFVYLVNVEGTNKYKIGCSSKPKLRLNALQGGSPMKLDLIAYYPVQCMLTEEKRWHKKLSQWREKREWFDLSGRIEIKVVFTFVVKHLVSDGFSKAEITDWLEKVKVDLLKVADECEREYHINAS